jgi:hypothetical protein
LRNYPITQPLTWPFLIALAELWWLEETATHGNQLEWIFLCIVTMAMGNKYSYKGWV